MAFHRFSTQTHVCFNHKHKKQCLSRYAVVLDPYSTGERFHEIAIISPLAAVFVHLCKWSYRFSDRSARSTSWSAGAGPLTRGGGGGGDEWRDVNDSCIPRSYCVSPAQVMMCSCNNLAPIRTGRADYAFTLARVVPPKAAETLPWGQLIDQLGPNELGLLCHDWLIECYSSLEVEFLNVARYGQSLISVNTYLYCASA